MQNKIDKRKIKQLNQISCTMAKTTALLVFVLLVTTIFNGYSAEENLSLIAQCRWVPDSCFNDPAICASCHDECQNDLQTTEAKTDNPKAENLP
jgi:hypothetical protein